MCLFSVCVCVCLCGTSVCVCASLARTIEHPNMLSRAAYRRNTHTTNTQTHRDAYRTQPSPTTLSPRMWTIRKSICIRTQIYIHTHPEHTDTEASRRPNGETVNTECWVRVTTHGRQWRHARAYQTTLASTRTVGTELITLINLTWALAIWRTLHRIYSTPPIRGYFMNRRIYIQTFSCSDCVFLTFGIIYSRARKPHEGRFATIQPTRTGGPWS